MNPFESLKTRGIKQFRLVVYQPRVYDGPREWIVSLDYLEKFAETARQKAATVRGAEEMHGKMAQAEWGRIYLHPDPNEADCAFCRAMATCPAAARKVQETVGADFDVIHETPAIAPETPAPSLAAKMAATGFIEDWCKAVRAETERRLLVGDDVPGWGLELGRKGPRKWRSAEEAETLIRKTFRLKLEDAFNLKLKSPTQLEELTNGKDPLVGPRQWAKAQALVVQSDPKPSVKPAHAITKPYKPEQPDAAAFGTVSEPCDLI